MAMAILQAKVAQLPEEWRIESAGTWAAEGVPANQKTQQVMDELGLDIRAHRSRSVTRELLTDFNLILVMESGHKEAMQIEFPDAADHTYLLSEMTGMNFTILDPVGGELDEYRATAQEIERIIFEGFDKITSLAQAGK